MNIKLPEGLTRTLGKAGLALRKASPEICVGAGIVGVIVSTVLACKQTTKLNDILEKHKKDASEIRKFSEEVKSGKCLEDYTDKDRQHDLTIVYSKTIRDIAKLYFLPAVTMGLSIASIIGGHKILRTRYISVSSALAATDKAFAEYRKRVADILGEDKEKEVRYGVKPRETVDDDQKITVVNGIDPGEICSPYAKFFQEGCLNWEKDPEANLTFLRIQESHANNLLRIRGYLLLNDVYDLLGIQRTKAGMVVGWIYDKNSPVGDNYVDFGLYNGKIARNRDFVNGYENVALLDFNVDGNIFDRLPNTR